MKKVKTKDKKPTKKINNQEIVLGKIRDIVIPQPDIVLP